MRPPVGRAQRLPADDRPRLCPTTALSAMPRPILATIHTDALRHNLARARRAAPDARVWAVVKANAYGHGIERVFDGLRGADGFALLDLAEAERVRALGWRGPILLLEGVFEPRDLELCSRLGLWHAVHCDEQIDMLAAHKTQLPHRVFLKMNSGMNRLGFAPRAFRAAWTRLNGAAAGRRDLADDALQRCRRRRAASPRQLAVFERADARPAGRAHAVPTARRRCAMRPAGRRSRGRLGAPGHRCSTAARPTSRSTTSAHWGLQPAMTLRARLIAVQQLAAGRHGRLRLELRRRRGRCASASSPAAMPTAIRATAPPARRCWWTACARRMVGRVSMDMITVDLTPLPQAGVGSEVTLWGRAAATGAALLPIDEVAQAAGTVGYELMCALAPRVPVRTG